MPFYMIFQIVRSIDFKLYKIKQPESSPEKRNHVHITPTLINLHWLPIKSRIKYKILLLVYKSIHGEGPSYLASLLEEYHPPRSLRSAAQSLLSEPRVHKKYGDRAFSVAGPKLWNGLPIEIRNSPSIFIFQKSPQNSSF